MSSIGGVATARDIYTVSARLPSRCRWIKPGIFFPNKLFNKIRGCNPSHPFCIEGMDSNIWRTRDMHTDGCRGEERKKFYSVYRFCTEDHKENLFFAQSVSQLSIVHFRCLKMRGQFFSSEYFQLPLLSAGTNIQSSRMLLQVQHT